MNNFIEQTILLNYRLVGKRTKYIENEQYI